MAYHSKSGKEFVGLRVRADGVRQVVYDAQTGVRVLVDIKDCKAGIDVIDEALREGVNARNVLFGVLNGLKSRNIGFDLSM
jgi:hypothetical protein